METDDVSSWLLGADELSDSPSRRDRVSAQEERKYRRRTSIFMEEVATRLNVDWQSLATAQVFFHFFYARHSFKRYKRYDVAVACLFLAAKVEECESPRARHLQSLLVLSHRIWHSAHAKYKAPDPASEFYQALQASVLACERALLHTVAFDLIVKKPHKHFMDLFKEALGSGALPPDKRKDIGPVAIHLLKMSHRTSLCLQLPPPAIAAASLVLAAAYHDVPHVLPPPAGAGDSVGRGSGAATAPPTTTTTTTTTTLWGTLSAHLDWHELQSLTWQVTETLRADACSPKSLKGLAAFEAKLAAAGVLTPVALAAMGAPPAASVAPTAAAAGAAGGGATRAPTAARAPPPPPPPPPSASASSASASSETTNQTNTGAIKRPSPAPSGASGVAMGAKPGVQQPGPPRAPPPPPGAPPPAAAGKGVQKKLPKPPPPPPHHHHHHPPGPPKSAPPPPPPPPHVAPPPPPLAPPTAPPCGVGGQRADREEGMALPEARRADGEEGEEEDGRAAKRQRG